MSHPWEQHLGEPDTAFGHFAVFKNLGPGRSYEEISTILNLKLGTIRHYGSKYDWFARARAWDREQDRIFIANTQERRVELAIKRWELGQRFMDKAAEDVEAGQLEPADRVRYLKEGSAQMGLALGESDKTVTVQGSRTGDPITLVQLPADPAERAELRRESMTALAGAVAAAAAGDPEGLLDLDPDVFEALERDEDR